jgi:hypothetical protein
MQPEQIYQELKDLAEKLGVMVSEQSFRASGIPVKSGFCIVKGQMHCIIDKNIGLRKKTMVLAQTIDILPHENMFVVPAVRDIIQKYGRENKSTRNNDQPGL